MKNTLPNSKQNSNKSKDFSSQNLQQAPGNFSSQINLPQSSLQQNSISSQNNLGNLNSQQNNIPAPISFMLNKQVITSNLNISNLSNSQSNFINQNLSQSFNNSNLPPNLSNNLSLENNFANLNISQQNYLPVQSNFENLFAPQPFSNNNTQTNMSNINPMIKNVNRKLNDKCILREISTNSDDNLNVVSVIITITGGSSYDNLFRKVPQKAPTGRVAVYEIDERAIPYFIDKFNNKEYDSEFTQKNYEFVEKINEIFDYIEQLEPECVLFNYECCSKCGDFKFLLEKETRKLISIVLKRKSNFMFSDFSVKSLLKTWDESLFGKNPFKKIGDCNKSLNLKFDPETLKKCDSPQLQLVGTLCENGNCKINVMNNTIVFGVDKEKIDNECYDLQVLTVVDDENVFSSIQNDIIFHKFKNDFTKSLKVQKKVESNIQNNIEKPQKINGPVSKYFVEINGIKGAVGHAIVKYKSGGSMILSAGHWIELSHLDVKLENLEFVSKNVYNNFFDKEIENIKNCNSTTEQEKTTQTRKLASQFIQQTCNNQYSQKMVFRSQKK